MFNVVKVALVNGAWVETVVDSAERLILAQRKASLLSNEQDDENDDPAMVSYIVKPAK